MAAAITVDLPERFGGAFPPDLFPPGVVPALLDHLDVVEVPAGQRVVTEGHTDRAMYFVLDGRARMLRDGIDLGQVGPGEHFGEIALIVERPRAASVEALEDMLLGRLTHAGYRNMLDRTPQLGALFLEQVVGALAARLHGMTDSVGVLIRDRALPRRAVLEVRVQGHRRTIRNGTPVGRLLPDAIEGHPVVAGLIDRRAVSLSTPVSGESVIEALTTLHWEGLRILRRSLALLVLEAAHRLQPDLRLRLGPSLGFAQQIEIVSGPRPDDLAEALERTTEALAQAPVTLSEEMWTPDEAREHFARIGWTESVGLVDMWRDGALPMATYGSVYALAFGPLLPSAAPLAGHRIVADDGGLLVVHRRAPAAARLPRLGEGRITAALDVSRQTTEMTRTHQRWMSALGVTSVSDFNRACISGDVAQIIRVGEGFQEKEIGRIADEIAERRDRIRVVCTAGPSSSGKTTFIKRLSVQLQVNGITPVGLSLDDYYVDRAETPRDERGELDFEAFEAIQDDLLQGQIRDLLRGRPVRTARYDFLEGKSHPGGGRELRFHPDNVLLIEGIHGLNPRLLSDIPESQIFRIFICPLAQLPFDRVTRLHASDIRLLRRIVRDRHGRNHDAAETIRRWPSVRAGERKHIFPHQAQADVVFDSALIYEPSVLKVYAERYLLEVPRDDDTHVTAFRLLQLLDRFVSIYPDHVPQTSLLREFIGNSGFERG